MIKVGVCGATGYSGRELVGLLHQHPEVEIKFLTSNQYVGWKFSDVFPQFRKKIALECQALEFDGLATDVNFVFLALPHLISMQMAKAFLAKDIRVIDLSADYRLKDPDDYQKWYGQPHQDPENLKHAVYGLTEIYRSSIKEASLIANPGCYSTGALLAMLPALKHGLIKPDGLIIDSKSGVSGAGRSLSLKTHFIEAHENMTAYKVGHHQHMPEIELILSDCVKSSVQLDFTPHLIPAQRGILTTAYGTLEPKVTGEQVEKVYRDEYGDEPFIRLLPMGEYPNSAHVQHTNYCDISLVINERTGKLLMLSAIDNLVKGAAGQALQNMNVMAGLEEKQGF